MKKYPNEYVVKVLYTVVSYEDETKTIRVIADTEEEAFSKAVDEVYEYEGADDESVSITEIAHDILSVESTEPGCRDDKTLSLFKEDKDE